MNALDAKKTAKNYGLIVVIEKTIKPEEHEWLSMLVAENEIAEAIDDLCGKYDDGEGYAYYTQCPYDDELGRKLLGARFGCYLTEENGNYYLWHCLG